MVYLLVGIAGMFGALLRHFLGLAITGWSGSVFPVATLIINLAGCFLLGGFTTYFKELKLLHPKFLTAIGTGLIGSFTTFSTFSVETVELFQDGRITLTFVYVLASLWGGLLFSWAGYRGGQLLLSKQRGEGAA